MKKITQIFAEKPWTFSFEFFPPKTEAGQARLLDTAAELARRGADFFSVTYGAGGSASHTTLDIVLGLQYRHDVAVMHHLTCVKHTYREIREQLAGMARVGVRNIMALRGDLPIDQPDFKLGEDQPKFAYELIDLLREYRDWFAIGVPGFPEGHPMAPSLELDSKYLRIKQDRGADFTVTQLFFENEQYFDFVSRVRAEGVTMRLIPGILPITNYSRLLDFCSNCGVSVPERIRDEFEPLRDDPEATREHGIKFVAEQCRDLLDRGAPGLHFYCLNKPEPVLTICNELGI